MRTVDGFIHRSIDGKQIDAVSKNGESMTLHCGLEMWVLWFVNPSTGELQEGEPAIVGTAEYQLAADTLAFPEDTHVHSCLKGKIVESAKSEGSILWLRLVGGESYGIAWVDSNGVRLAVEPCLYKVNVLVTPEPVCAYGESWGA